MMLRPIWHFCVMTGNRGDKAIRASIARSIHKYVDVPIAYFNVKFEELTAERIEQLNNEASMLIIGGSGLYTNYNKSSGWYFPCKTELFKKIRVPIVLVGIGCNNNIEDDLYSDLKPEVKKSIKLINDKAVLSSVRDIRTYDMLSSLGITKQELIPDPALFLKYPTNTKQKRVAINISQHIPLLGRYDGRQDIREKNLYYFSGVIDYLQKKGYTVVFIAHDAMEQTIINELSEKSPDLEYINGDSINNILAEYSRCEFSIGLRMHSNILSLAAGTPFISVYYDHKSTEFMKLLNYKLGVSVTSNYYNKLMQLINIMIEKHEEIETYLIDKRETYRVSYNDFIKRVLCKLRNQ